MPVTSERSSAEPHALNIRSSAGDYDVLVGRGLLAEVLSAGADAVIVDRVVATRLELAAGARIVLLDADEATKTLAGCERVILELREQGVRRGDHLLVVGGGVVQDVGTFVADVYMRGLSWTYAPTTLMAMADSCIGGKSSINVGGVKNLVGGFHPPTRVVIDPLFLDTLPASAVAAGLAEAVKICFCRGQASFDEYLERHAAFAQEPEALLEHVLSAKKWFIEIDEHDQAERLLLNFGHTFGHALEAATDHRLSHGLGVAVGTLCALRHPAGASNGGTAALDEHCRLLLAAAPDLGEVLGRVDSDRFERAFRSDKKHGPKTFRLILPAPGEGVQQVETASDEGGWSDVATATRDALASLGGDLR